MDISPTDVSFGDDMMTVGLSDDRIIGVPLAWYPRLLAATPAQRRDVRLGRYGLHWEAIDEDISVEGVLAGKWDNSPPAAREIESIS